MANQPIPTINKLQGMDSEDAKEELLGTIYSKMLKNNEASK